MDTFELEEEMRTALIDDADLMSLLPLGTKAIFHYVAPKTEPKRYPIIVYKPIEDVPALAGDDCEVAHRVTLKIDVVAKERDTKTELDKFQATCKILAKIIRDLGYVRQKTTPSLTDGKLIVSFEFIKNILC